MKLHYNIEDDFIKFISSPDAIFHYTKRSLALEKILYENCFKFSFFSMANDPFEYKNKLIGAAGWGWNDDVERKIDETSRILDKFLTTQTLFISCCENEIRDDVVKNHGFLKSRMWSQYGESHEGICLVFSKKKLFNQISEKFKPSEFMMWQGEVEYKELISEDSNHDTMNIDSNTYDNTTPKEVAISHLETYWKELLFRKQSDYKDEQEYRFVMVLKNNSTASSVQAQFEVDDCLAGIILGDRFSKVYFPSVINVCNDLNIQCKKLHWEAGQYFLLNVKKS